MNILSFLVSLLNGEKLETIKVEPNGSNGTTLEKENSQADFEVEPMRKYISLCFKICTFNYNPYLKLLASCSGTQQPHKRPAAKGSNLSLSKRSRLSPQGTKRKIVVPARYNTEPPE